MRGACDRRISRPCNRFLLFMLHHLNNLHNCALIFKILSEGGGLAQDILVPKVNHKMAPPPCQGMKIYIRNKQGIKIYCTPRSVVPVDSDG